MAECVFFPIRVFITEHFYVVMTHHTAKANLEKGSSWPPEAKEKVQSYAMGLVLTQPISPTPWT